MTRFADGMQVERRLGQLERELEAAKMDIQELEARATRAESAHTNLAARVESEAEEVAAELEKQAGQIRQLQTDLGSAGTVAQRTALGERLGVLADNSDALAERVGNIVTPAEEPAAPDTEEPEPV